MSEVRGLRARGYLNDGIGRKSQRLRVLFINDTSRNGGPGRTLLDILKFLDPSRVHRTVLIPRKGIVSRRLIDSGVTEDLIFEPDMIENIFEPFSRAIERRDFDAPPLLKLLRSSGNVARAARGLFRLLRHVRKDRYDIVFCNGTTANFIGGAIAGFTGTPVIWHVLYSSVAPIISSLHARIASLKGVRAIVCVSRPTVRQFEHCRDKVRLIHDAVDLDEFTIGGVKPSMREELGLDSRVVIFGSHGRILPRKGFIELIRIARIVVDRLDTNDRDRCRFIVLGDTPQDLQPDHLEECRAFVNELHLQDHVQFIGYCVDVRPYLADFDVAIVPSIYEDPLPRAVLESMALSKPVAAFAVGGIGEMIDDGVEGRLVRGAPPDVEGLAEACLGYFRDPAMRRSHGAAARRRIEQDFDARRHTRILQDELFRVAKVSA